MATADRGRTKPNRISRQAAGQLIVTGLLLYLASVFPASGQSKEVDLAQRALDNGDYSTAIRLAKTVADRSSNNNNLIHSALDIILLSQIAQQRYDEAAITIEKWLKVLSLYNADPNQKAHVYLRTAELLRSERKFAEALKHAKKAAETAPFNKDIQAAYYLLVGRIMFSSGYDLSAIVWLEKAEKLFAEKPVSSGKLDTYRILSLAGSLKMNYPAALRYSEKLISAAADSKFKHRYRQALFEAATLLSSIGQKRKAFAARQEGLKLSLEHQNTYQARNFLASLLLNSLYDGDIPKAIGYLQQLKALDVDDLFGFETALGAATIAGLTGQRAVSEKLFKELEKRETTSPFILPSWKRTIAEKNKEWEHVITHNRALLELAVEQNFREDLPGIYLSFATAYFHLDQGEKSHEYLDKTLSLIEEIQISENKNLSLGLLETYHNAYRLSAQTKLRNPFGAFEQSDYLKARLLKDKINKSPTTRQRSEMSPDLRRQLEILSLGMIEAPEVASEISRLETSFTTHVPERTLPKPDFSGLDTSADLDGKTVVSYFFTLDRRLLAFVWEKGKPMRSVRLPVSEDDVETNVLRTEDKIKNRIFFKRDGKELFDKLLKPLSISGRHLIIVPDKHLWKVPFQALSADGERYLIEDKVISYAPSVSILLEQLRRPRPVRRTIQAFANPAYNNRYLQYVNAEATSVAGLFNSRPVLNATVEDFRRLSDSADIVHFSMHAQVDNDQPLDSFLGFREIGKNSGRLTVEDLSNIRLKKGSLVFLASCDTNNVLSGEGLISLAWGMMGSGATTVISAQWEANDKFTGIFADKFYRYYMQGISSAESLQKASLEMIKNKSNNMHEPYYWADFTLNGDFR
jgi:CHAT domain-containing protein/tetratricopeptide (TPR) repeat protein